MAILFLLTLFVFAPVILMLIGFIMLFSSREQRKALGKKLLLWGAISLAAVILIGYAICSNMKFSVH